VKKCSASLAIKEMQTKTMLRLNLIPVRMAVIETQITINVDKDMVKKESSYTARSNVNEYNHYRKHYGGSS
jgi:hypothetical protein